MAPDSRPPLSHQRPPLATRLRRSFDSKRSKSEVTSPTSPNGYAVQDPDALQYAMDQAINSEAFQNAIAANLAKLIKPSIKSALDTIQPVVEAVYSHDVLLRKTNKSVEDILDRMDTIPEEGHDDGRVQSPRERSASAGSFYDLEFKALLEKSNKRTVATLAELSNAVQSNNSKIAGMEASLGQTKESVEYLKAYLQNQLDQVQADMGRIVDAMEAERKDRQTTNRDTSLFSSHTIKLDAISTNLAGLKGFSETSEKFDSIFSELNALRALVDASSSQNNRRFTELESKLAHVTTAIQAHGTTLEEVRQRDNTPEILAAVQKSNASHDSHAVILGKIKDRSLAEPTPATENGSSETATSLQELKSHLASLRENIEVGLTSNHENVNGLGSKIEHVLATVEGHKASDSSAEILAAVQRSNDCHASHSSALDGLKSLVVVPTPASDNSNLDALESQISSIITTLDSHTASFGELKAATSTSTELVPADDTLKPVISSIATTLELHTRLLSEIKDDVSAEILTSLHDIGQTQAGHTATLSEIRESDVSDEILTALHTSNESHTNHESAFEKLHVAVQASNDSHEKHGISLGEIKSRSLETAPAAEGGRLGDLDTKMGGIVSTLEEQNATLAAIKEAASSSVESHAAHALSLSEIKEVATASKDLHESHASTLSEIKDASATSKELYGAHSATLGDLVIAAGASNEVHASHTSTLAELKGLPPTSTMSEIHGLATLETEIRSIIVTLESQNNTLSSIKETSSNPELLATIKESNNLLTSHTALLDSIKANSSHEDILAKISSIKTIVEETKSGIDLHSVLIKDLHSETKDSHSSLATTVSALAIGGAVGGGAGLLTGKDDDDSSSKELLSEVKAVREIMEKSSQSITSVAAQIDINHTTVITSITTLSDELKAEVDASSTEIASSISKLGTGFESVSGEVKAVGVKVDELGSGVHLNEKGLGQLKDRGPVVSVREVSEIESQRDVASVEEDSVAEAAPIELEEAKEPEVQPETVVEPESTIEHKPTVAGSVIEHESAEEIQILSEPVVEPITERSVEPEPVVEPEQPAAEEKPLILEHAATLQPDATDPEPRVISKEEAVTEESPADQQKIIPGIVEAAEQDSEPEPTPTQVVNDEVSISEPEKLEETATPTNEPEPSEESRTEQSLGRPAPGPTPESLAQEETVSDSKSVEEETLDPVPIISQNEEEHLPILEDEVEKGQAIPESPPAIGEESSITEPESSLKEKEIPLPEPVEEEVPPVETTAHGSVPKISSVGDEEIPRDTEHRPSLLENDVPVTTQTEKIVPTFEPEEHTPATELPSVKDEEVSAFPEPESATREKEIQVEDTPIPDPVEKVEDSNPTTEEISIGENEAPESSPILEEKVATKPEPTADVSIPAPVEVLPVVEESTKVPELEEPVVAERIPESTIAVEKPLPGPFEETEAKQIAEVPPVEMEKEEPVALSEIPTKEEILEPKNFEAIDGEIIPSKDFEACDTPTIDDKHTTLPKSQALDDSVSPDTKSTESALKSPPLPEATDDESEPPSAPVTPISPAFPEVETPNGKKGKKSKKGKKGKKEKVPFVLEGEEAGEGKGS